MKAQTDGAVTTLDSATPQAREAMLDAVREANGRRALRPAETVADARADIEAFLVCPAWSAGETAADVSAETLREVYGLDAAGHAVVWMLYTAAARRLGFAGDVPVPVLDAGLGGETGPTALA